MSTVEDEKLSELSSQAIIDVTVGENLKYQGATAGSGSLGVSVKPVRGFSQEAKDWLTTKST